MVDFEARAAELRAADAAGAVELRGYQEAARKQLELSRAEVGKFIGRLAGRIPAVSLYAETYRKGGAEHGDMKSERTITGYDDVQTGYVRVGGGWVVREYQHNDGDILDGVFVLDNGKFTRRLSKVETAPTRRFDTLPELPFYHSGLHIMEDQLARPLPMDDLFPETADFAHQENQDLLTRALMRYGVL